MKSSFWNKNTRTWLDVWVCCALKSAYSLSFPRISSILVQWGGVVCQNDRQNLRTLFASLELYNPYRLATFYNRCTIRPSLSCVRVHKLLRILRWIVNLNNVKNNVSFQNYRQITRFIVECDTDSDTPKKVPIFFRIRLFVRTLVNI